VKYILCMATLLKMKTTNSTAVSLSVPNYLHTRVTQMSPESFTSWTQKTFIIIIVLLLFPCLFMLSWFAEIYAVCTCGCELSFSGCSWQCRSRKIQKLIRLPTPTHLRQENAKHRRHLAVPSWDARNDGQQSAERRRRGKHVGDGRKLVA